MDISEREIEQRIGTNPLSQSKLALKELQPFLMMPAKKARANYKSCNQYSAHVRKGSDVSESDATEWTERLDTLLNQAVGAHGRNWAAVALYLKIHTMAQFNPPYVAEDGNLPHGMGVGDDNRSRRNSEATGSSVSGGPCDGSSSGNSRDSNAVTSVLPTLVTDTRNSATINSTATTGTTTNSTTNTTTPSAVSHKTLGKRARIKSNIRQSANIIHHYPTPAECALRWNTTFNPATTTSHRSTQNTAHNTSYNSVDNNTHNIPTSTYYAEYAASNNITSDPIQSVMNSVVDSIVRSHTHASHTTQPIHHTNSISNTATMTALSNTATTLHTPLGTTSLHTTTSLPPSVTIYNTTYEHPWTDDDVALLHDLIAQQQAAHQRLNATLCASSSGTSTNDSTTTTNSAATTLNTNSTTNPTTTITTSATKNANTNSTNSTDPANSAIDRSISNPFKINWTLLSLQLGRAPNTIIKKHNALKQNTFKHGTFSNAEDVHIITRYLQWQCVHSAKNGIWCLLERELNRKDKRISERWRHILCKRLGTLVQLDASHNIVDPVRALRVWNMHQEEIRQFGSVNNGNVFSVYIGNGCGSSSGGGGSSSAQSISVDANTSANSSTNTSKSNCTSNTATSTTTATTVNNTINIIHSTTTNSTNSTDCPDNRSDHTPHTNVNTTHAPSIVHTRTHSTHSTYSDTDTNTSSANDTTMSEISTLLQTIHSDEMQEYEVYGGSVWNSIDNNSTHHYNHSTTSNNTTYNPNTVYGGSVWSSIKGPTNANVHPNHTGSGINQESDDEIQELVLQGIIRWNDKLDKRLREAVSRFPRDWVKVSEYMGIDCSSTKCRKRWARLQHKYQQTLSNAAQGLRDTSTGPDPDALEPDHQPDLPLGRVMGEASVDMSMEEENSELYDLGGDVVW